MEKLNIPEGYQQLMPYLILENAAGFIDFTAKVFDATQKHKEMRDDKIIKHAEISINGCVVMFADPVGEYKQLNGSFFLYVGDCDAVFKKAIENGATSINEPAGQTYGRSGGFKDPFGNTWWVTAV
jgi:PhnB protein